LKQIHPKCSPSKQRTKRNMKVHCKQSKRPPPPRASLKIYHNLKLSRRHACGPNYSPASFPTIRHAMFISTTSTSPMRHKPIFKCVMLIFPSNLILIPIHRLETALAALPVIRVFDGGRFSFSIGDVGNGAVTTCPRSPAVGLRVGARSSLDTGTYGGCGGIIGERRQC
jgi:hypothetical protein